MNKKILSVYYKSIISAVILIVAIWIAVSMLLVFSNNEVDENLPQYRILTADSYITISDEEVNVSQEFLESLSKYDLWMQVLDEDGNAIYQENVPLGVPQKYTAIQLVDACLKSDKIPGMTVFASDIETNPGYCILIGCDSHVVNKLSYSFVGNGRDEMTKVLIIFLIVLVSVVILYSFLFMKRITEPIGNIMGAIGKIDDEQFDMPVYHGQIFSEVFCELGKLREKLKQTKCQRLEWTANISHDIKTPLSTIKGYAEVLADDEYDFTGEEVKQYMSETLKAEESIEELVEELNLSSKLSEGNVKLCDYNLTQLRQLKKVKDEAKRMMFLSVILLIIGFLAVKKRRMYECVVWGGVAASVIGIVSLILLAVSGSGIFYGVREMVFKGRYDVFFSGDDRLIALIPDNLGLRMFLIYTGVILAGLVITIIVRLISWRKTQPHKF